LNQAALLSAVARVEDSVDRLVLVSAESTKSGAYEECDRHGHELAGESPVIALERREYVGEGKGARRNSLDLPDEG